MIMLLMSLGYSQDRGWKSRSLCNGWSGSVACCTRRLRWRWIMKVCWRVGWLASCVSSTVVKNVLRRNRWLWNCILEICANSHHFTSLCIRWHYTCSVGTWNCLRSTCLLNEHLWIISCQGWEGWRIRDVCRRRIRKWWGGKYCLGRWIKIGLKEWWGWKSLGDGWKRVGGVLWRRGWNGRGERLKWRCCVGGEGVRGFFRGWG